MNTSGLGISSGLRNTLLRTNDLSNETHRIESIFRFIQAEDRAIRERGRQGGVSLVRELLVFFGIQMGVLVTVLLYLLAS